MKEPEPQRALSVLLVLFALSTAAIGIANVIFALAALTWLWTLRREGRFAEAFSGRQTLLFGIFVALLALSAVFSLHPGPSLYALKGVFTFLLFPLFSDWMENERRIAWVAGALAVAGLVEAGIGLWQYFHGADTLADRIAATLSHYMTFSGLMLVIALLLLGVAIEGRRFRWPALAGALVLSCAILLTFTRNAYVGFFVALAAYLAVRRPRLLLGLPVLVLLVYLAAPAAIERRLLSTFNPSDPTNRDRLDMAVAGWRMVRDRPVFGMGMSLVKPYYPLYRVPDAVRWRVPHLHDNVIQIAAESGVFAAAAYAALVASFFAECLRRLRRETDPDRRGLLTGAFLALAGITAAGFFEYNFGDVEVVMTTLIVMAIPFSRAFRRGDGTD